MSLPASPLPASPSQSALEARHFLVRGHVQGVYYRATMIEVARRLGITGWVRNRSDGRVEACAWGSAAALQSLADWAQRGPDAARVDAVVIGNVPDAGIPPADFVQRETL